MRRSVSVGFKCPERRFIVGRFSADYHWPVLGDCRGCALQSLGPVTADRFVAISGSGTGLPNVLPEIEGFRRLFPVTEYHDVQTTPREALSRCKETSVVHFACHCNWQLNDFYGSGLQLKGGTLTCARILADGDFRRTGLVTLAGCATGASTGSVDGLRGYAGLDVAFLTRGARSTVATQWEIDDLASLLFHEVFYVALHSGANVQDAWSAGVRFLRSGDYFSKNVPAGIAEALDTVQPRWRAQIRSRDETFQDVFFWGAFRCSGWTWGGLRQVQTSSLER